MATAEVTAGLEVALTAAVGCLAGKRILECAAAMTAEGGLAGQEAGTRRMDLET